MKHALKRTLILFTALICTSTANGVDDIIITDGVQMGKFTHDYSAAMSHAKEENLPVMLVFTGSDWCGWCKKMDRNVFTKPEWESYSKSEIVQVWLDFPRNKDLVPEKYRARNAELKKEFGIRGYPKYVILDSDGSKLGELGAGRDKTPTSFQSELEKVLIATDRGISKCTGKMKADDASLVMAAYKAEKAARSALNELESKHEAAAQTAADKKEALNKALETGKVNQLSEEDQAEYRIAKATLGEAQEMLETWKKKNLRFGLKSEQKPKLEELRKAVSDAQQAFNAFDL